MNKKRLILIGAAAVVALAIIGGMTSNSEYSGSTVGATQTAQPVSNDKWRVTESRSAMDDSKGVLLTLDSDDVIRGPMETTRPSLIVRCKEGKTDVYVVTGVAANIEEDSEGGPSDYHTVRTRMDDATSQTQSWYESTDHTALFVGDGQELARELSKANTYTFQFTPFDGSPQTMRFDVRGLDPHLHKLAEACGWGYE